MVYSKITWVNNSSPAINDTNLNKIETGIDEAHDAIENTTTGHDHDGTDSKKVTAANVVNVAAGNVAAIEKDSKDATTAVVIDTTNDDVATGDEIRFDCDVAGTGATGMEIRLGFSLP